MLRLIVRIVLRLLYRIELHGGEALTGAGPVLLAPNHVSWLDWLFLGAFLGDDWRFVSSKTTAQLSWVHRRIMINRRTFPVDPNSAQGIREMAEFLSQGGKLVLFPEGRLSRTGNLMKFYDGAGFLVYRTEAAVIFAHLRGAVRVPWVKHPHTTEWFPKVTVHLSRRQRLPRWEGLRWSQVRPRTVQWLRDGLVAHHFAVEQAMGAKHLPAALVESRAIAPDREAMEDVSETVLSPRRLVIGADVLAGVWRSKAGLRKTTVAVLLPNVNATPVVLFSLWRSGHVPALLNFSLGVSAMAQACALAGAEEIITSRVFLERARLTPTALEEKGLRLIYMEDVRSELSIWTKGWNALRHRLVFGWNWQSTCIQPTDTAVILFTSGSEGVPKGVMLSHANVLANTRQIATVLDVTESDSVLNALPLFHSFGLVGGTLFPLLLGAKIYLYPSPLHYRTIPGFVYDRGCTVLLGTNTFLQGYAKKAHAYDFHAVRLVVAGAEKLQDTTRSLWANTFGVRILEGYGATECSPVLALNTRMENRLGAAGRFVPGVEYRLEPVDGVATGGRLWVRGPNIMKGYLNPEAQAAFAAGDGWYDTGDVAAVDEDRFVTLLGRLKRFAKVSGEMVSLTAVEEALQPWLAQRGGVHELAVVAVPDTEKGERLIVVTNDSTLTLEDVRRLIRQAQLTNLSAPRVLRVVPNLPKLGTGKTDYRELQQRYAND